MPQIFSALENIPSLVRASGTSVTLAATSNGQATRITIGGQQYQLSSSLTLSTAIVGAGGLDSGSLAASQTYYVYAVANQSTQAVSLVASLSVPSSGPTMPSGYGAAYKWVGGFTSDATPAVSSILGRDVVGYPVATSNIALLNTIDSYSSNTKLGLMQYVHGTAYNGGISGLISTGGAASPSVKRAVLIPYQMVDGTWRVKFNIHLTFASTSNASATFALQGTSLKQVSALCQAFTLTTFSGTGLNYSAGAAVAYSTNNTFYCVITGTAVTDSIATGDVELDSKPTWAY